MTAPDIDSLDTYGGALNNYVAGVVDPTTDRDAAAANEAYASCAAMTHTAVRAYVRMTLQSAAAPTLVAHDSLWGNLPGVAPTLSWVATGHVRVTWPTTVLDELQASHTVTLRDGWANVRSATALQAPQVVPAGGGVVDVYIFDSSGAATDAAGVTIGVFVI